MFMGFSWDLNEIIDLSIICELKSENDENDENDELWLPSGKLT